MNFKDKVVVVTGSSRGIGNEIIKQFAKYGAKVVINYNSSYDEASRLDKFVKEKYNSDSCFFKADISCEEDVKEFATFVFSKYGKVDILVNNASIAIDSEFECKDINNFKKVINTNLVGTYLVTREFAKYMSDNSSIINISSDNALDRYYPESCDYDASKAGVISLTHNMAKFYSPKIRVNCICPGWINTDMNNELDFEQKKNIVDKILLNRFGECVDVANLVLFLASDNASYINDSIIKINGGINNE